MPLRAIVAAALVDDRLQETAEKMPLGNSHEVIITKRQCVSALSSAASIPAVVHCPGDLGVEVFPLYDSVNVSVFQ